MVLPLKPRKEKHLEAALQPLIIPEITVDHPNFLIQTYNSRFKAILLFGKIFFAFRLNFFYSPVCRPSATSLPHPHHPGKPAFPVDQRKELSFKPARQNMGILHLCNSNFSF